VAVTIAIAVAISIAVAGSVAIVIAVAHHRCHWPLPLGLPSTISAAVSVVLPSAIAVAVAIALPIGHCCLCHHRPTQLPSLSAITAAVAVGHFGVLLPWRSENCIRPIEAKMLILFYFCLDSGQHTDQSWMTDQVSSGDGQHQRWAASGKHQAASEGSGWQQGGSRGAAGWRH
jgi:hypothetical protein